MAIGENAKDGTSLRSVPFHSIDVTSTVNCLKEITGNNITVPNEIRMLHFYFWRNGTKWVDTFIANMHIYGTEIVW